MEQPNTQQEPMNEAGLKSEDIQMFKEGYQLCKQFIYQEAVFNALMKDAQQNPANAISGVVITSMLRVQDELGQFSLPIAATLGVTLLDSVGEALEQVGVMQNTPELQTQLFEEGIQQWLQANNYPPEEVAQMMQEIGAPQEMVSQIAQSGQQAPQQPAAPQQAQPEGIIEGVQ